MSLKVLSEEEDQIMSKEEGKPPSGAAKFQAANRRDGSVGSSDGEGTVNDSL